MRWLMILALLLSALVMVRPLPAQAESIVADCHGLIVHGDEPAEQSGRPRSLAHHCPGCATFAAPFSPAMAKLRLPLPRLLRGAAWPPSLLTVPLTPPPRVA